MQFFPASAAHGSPNVAAFFEQASGSWQYVAWCPATKKAVIIDPVLDFDPAAGAVWTYSADELIGYAQEQGLTVEWVLDTHPHADHFSAAHYIKHKLGGAALQAIGKRVLRVQDIWSDFYGDDALAGRPEFWDRLFDAGDTITVGNCELRVSHSPGHTLASVSYTMGDAIFAHDTLMYPDSGTSRCDFPGGSSAELWDTIQAILSLPADTRVFVGHDYCKDGRAAACMATVSEHRAKNIHVKDGTTREGFIAARDARDATLPLPGRMLYALQVNIRGGQLPEPDEKGRAVFSIPVNRFRSDLERSYGEDLPAAAE